MSSIEDRIVEMRFDNGEFERGAKDTMNTLKNLDNSLKFENGTKGFANISDAAGKVDLSHLVNGIESVSHGFSAMEIAAMTVISNITTSVMHLASTIANGLFIEPITSGLSEYEEKIDQIKTTMVNSGASLEDVNDTLDRLNVYADKTIFKFSDMTNALKKFTMAGVTDLDLAESMIEGIGNAAGEAGLKTEQASSAFYMISQAMSAGKMSLYQWRTLENTGFASMKFKQNLLDTATALGTLRKESDGVYYAVNEKGKQVEVTLENMRNTLTETGWFNKDVMTAIFSRYSSEAASLSLGLEDISEQAFHATTDIITLTQMWDTLKEAAQSGWTESWENIIGNYEEAKNLWTSVNNEISSILDAQSQNRNALLSEWKELGGRTYILNGLRDMWTTIKTIVTEVSNTLKTVFPPITAQRLVIISAEFNKFARGLIPTEEQLRKVRFLALTVANVFKELKRIVGGVGSAIKEGFREIFPKNSISLIDGITTVIKKLRLLLEKIKPNLDGIKRAAQGVFAVVDIGLMFIKALFNFLVPIINMLFPKAEKGLTGIAGGIGDVLVNLRNWIKENEIFEKIFGTLTKIATSIISAFKKVSEFVVTTFGPSFEIIKNSLAGIFTKESFESNASFFEKFQQFIKKFAEGIANAIGFIVPIAGKLIDFLSRIVTSMIDNVSKIIDSFSDGGIGKGLTGLTAGFGAIMGIFGTYHIVDEIGDTKDAILSLFNVVKDGGDLLGGLNELKDQAKFSMMAQNLKIFAIAIAILAASFILLSMCDLGKVGTAFALISATIGELMLTLQSFQKLSGKFNKDGASLGSLTRALLTFSVSVLIIAIAMKTLAKIETSKMYDGLAAVVTLVAEMTLVAKTMGKNEGEFNRVAKGLISLAVSVLIIAVAVKMLSKLDVGAMWSAIGAISVLFLVIAGFMKIIDKEAEKNLNKIAGSLILIAVSMVIFATAIGKIAEIDGGGIVKALVTIAALLVMMDLFSKVLKEQGMSIIYAGVAMVAIAAAMLVFAMAISIIGSMPVNQVLQGTIAIIALVGAFALMSKLVKPLNMIAMAAALAVMAVSMAVFASAIKLLTTIPLNQLYAYALALPIIFAVFGVLAAVLQPLLGPLAAIIGLFAVFSVSVLLIGVGVTALSVGLTALGIALATFGGTLVVFITEILSLIPILFEMLAAGIVSFITALAGSVVAIVDAVVAIGMAILDALIQLIPKFCEFVVVLVTNLCDTLVTLAPVLVDTAIRLCIAVWEAIKPYLEQLWPKIKEALVKAKNKIVEFKNNMIDAGHQLIQGLIDGIKNKVQEVIDAARDLAERALGTIKGIFDIHSPSRVAYSFGEFLDLGLANGIKDTAGTVVNAAGRMAVATVDMLKETIGNISDVIADDNYQPTITPVLDLTNVEEGSKTLKSILSSQNGGILTANASRRASVISGNLDAIGGIGTTVSNNVTNNFNMTQNNTSPKALSAIDIYRDTKSQFAQLKGLVNQA